jgi:cardiolipin synthase
MPWITSTFYFALLQSGVKVYEYLPSIYHAKNYVIDDWMQIGSTNLNSRSLLYDLEIDFKITHPKNRQILMAEIKKDLKNSLVITSDFFDKISLLRKFMTYFFLLFKRWI